ncbi:MAG TPA: hypothetical protein VMS01_15265 [Stellaceae bacterium]|nr:hypothetical protein [Stellaceae bacterium]
MEMKLQVMTLVGDVFGDPPHGPRAEVERLKNLDKEGRRDAKFAQRPQQKAQTLGTAIDRAVDELTAERAIPLRIGKRAADTEFGIDGDANLGRRQVAVVGRRRRRSLCRTRTHF